MRMRKSLGGWVLRYTLVINSALLIVLGVVLTGLSGNTLQEELVSAMDRVLTQTNSVLDTYLIDMRSRLVKLAAGFAAGLGFVLLIRLPVRAAPQLRRIAPL